MWQGRMPSTLGASKPFESRLPVHHYRQSSVSTSGVGALSPLRVFSPSSPHPPSSSSLTRTTRSDCWLKFEVLEERRTRPVPRNNEAAGSVLDVASPPLLPPPPPSPPLPPPLLLLLLLYARAAAAASSVALLPSLPLAEEDLLPFRRRIQSI